MFLNKYWPNIDFLDISGPTFKLLEFIPRCVKNVQIRSFFWYAFNVWKYTDAKEKPLFLSKRDLKLELILQNLFFCVQQTYLLYKIVRYNIYTLITNY